MSQDVRAKRAVLYLRVSSRGQVETDYDPEGNSIPAQRKACERRAEDLGMEVVGEYVEPGKSGMTVDGRPKFLEMMARIRNEKDVGAIIVYARSRMHRDTADAALTRRELKKLGVQLISIMDYTEDSYVGDLVAAILDGVNEYQSRASGADVAYKMGAKAANGGTPFQAPIGYRNAGATVEGRQVRTVVVDEERAQFIRMMFELYASGTYSLKELQRTVTDAGLRTRPSKRCPAGREIPMYTVGTILQNRYYLGRVAYKGAEHQGRHEPLVSQELFDRVQEVLRHKNGGIRKRVYDHPLKGVLWCGRCRTRFYLDTVTNGQGSKYAYFVCSGRAKKTCRSERVPVAVMEAEVREHYSRLRIPTGVASELRLQLDLALHERQRLDSAVREQLTGERARLERQQDQVLDLVGDPDWPQTRLNEKIRDLRDQVARVTERLERTGSAGIEAAGQAVTLLLELLDNPHRFLDVLPEAQHRAVHLGFFGRLYVAVEDGERVPKVVGNQVSDLLEPLTSAAHRTTAGKTKGPLGGPACFDKTNLAGVPGLEPRTTEPESAVLPITPYPNGVAAPRSSLRRRGVTVPDARAPLQTGSCDRDDSVERALVRAGQAGSGAGWGWSRRR
jgi:site-specific DNA recombinase